MAAGISSSISQPIAEHGLDLGDARLLVSDSSSTAGLIPGTSEICFVSVSDLLGTVVGCTPYGWAATHGGWGIMGTVNGETLVAGVVPDTVSKVEFRSGQAVATPVALGKEQAYSQVLPTAPSSMVWVSGAQVVRQTNLTASRMSAYGDGAAG